MCPEPWYAAGVILEMRINLWGVTPSGVRVLWNDGEIEIVLEDELEVINESR